MTSATGAPCSGMEKWQVRHSTAWLRFVCVSGLLRRVRPQNGGGGWCIRLMKGVLARQQHHWEQFRQRYFIEDSGRQLAFSLTWEDGGPWGVLTLGVLCKSVFIMEVTFLGALSCSGGVRGTGAQKESGCRW